MLILAILMFLVAIAFSMLGQGGGVLYTPIQVFYGVDFHRAATTSLFLIMVTSFSSSLVYRRAKKIDWPLALVLETFMTAGGFLGGLWSGQFSGAFLSGLFAAIISVAAYFMIRPPGAKPANPLQRHGLLTWHRTLGDEAYCVDLALAGPFSFVAGIASGMVGVGGGILNVTMMVLLFGVPTDIAIGSSAFMIGLTAAGGFAGHVTSGHWDWQTSLMLAAAVFAGGQIGSRISLGLNQRRLRRIFGWFLLVIAASMVARLW